jgi:hypothetical protein
MWKNVNGGEHGQGTSEELPIDRRAAARCKFSIFNRYINIFFARTYVICNAPEFRIIYFIFDF